MNFHEERNMRPRSQGAASNQTSSAPRRCEVDMICPAKNRASHPPDERSHARLSLLYIILLIITLGFVLVNQPAG